MIKVSKIEHRSETRILFTFGINEEIKSKIKSLPSVSYTSTYKGWYVNYNKENWANFLKLGLEYEIEHSGTTGCAKPSSVHAGENIADVPQCCTEKAADTKIVSIKYYHPHFYIKGALTENMIQDIKLLPKTYWNMRYENWVVSANAETIKIFFQNWKIIDEEQYINWEKQISKIIDPPTCTIYASPQYPEKILIQLTGVEIDINFMKHVPNRNYNESKKFWMIPDDEICIKRIIEYYTSIKTKVINRL